jgi:hypothetical protein
MVAGLHSGILAAFRGRVARELVSISPDRDSNASDINSQNRHPWC